MDPCYRPHVKYCVPTNESIYNLLPAIVDKPVKDKLYKSIYTRKVVVDNECGRNGHKTFGQTDLRLRGPRNYLRKGEGRPRILLEKTVKKTKESCESGEKKKDACDELNNAPAPKHDTTGVCPGAKERVHIGKIDQTKYKYDFNPNKDYFRSHESTVKDFNDYLDKREAKKGTNFIEVNKKKTASFKKDVDRSRSMVVFTRKGDKYLYTKSGFDNKFSTSNKLGKIPTYVENRRLELEKSVKDFNEKLKKKVESEAMKKLSEPEREELLDCLEASREKLQMRYQALPLVVSSLKVKTARIKLEDQLAQLEKDIRLITAHSQIYVAQ